MFWIYGSTGRVGIGTFDTNNGALTPWVPEARLHVYETSTTGTSIYGVVGSSGEGAPGYGVGVLGEASTVGPDGVLGRTTATTGSGWGVHGVSYSTSGIGVEGYATASTGSTYGIEGEAMSNAGIGVGGYANATSGTTYGVRGESQSPDGAGVYGYASATSGSNSGVIGSTASSTGYGVYGYAPTYGIAVYGLNTSTLGWAGYFAGDVGIEGYLYKYGGGFRIDHPLDPDKKYLVHSFVESPDMKNIYDGVVTLDENGQAWVELPDWFEALNQDFRYQLTSIGQFAPVYVAQGIQDNSFQIAGGVAGMQVSWQVTGIRHDAYAEAHPILVEEDKDAGKLSSAESATAPQVLTSPASEPPGSEKQ